MDRTTRAIENYAELFHLEQDKGIIRLDLFAKTCFREIGELLEASIKEFSRLILLMKNPNRDLEKESFGKLVSMLLEDSELEVIYTPLPYNIPINQWRNIAFHSNYSINRKSDLIECRYGKNGKISLTRKDLFNLMLTLHELYKAHKLAYTFFFMDNIHDISPKTVNKNMNDPSEDTILVSLYEIAYSYGFEVIDVKKSNKVIEIKIKEYKRYDTNIFKNTEMIAKKMCIILQKEIDLNVIPIFDISPYTLKPRFLTKTNS